jgi:hypothetical protein
LFAQTFAPIPSTPATIAGTASDMATIGDVAEQVTPTWAFTFAWCFFFCHISDAIASGVTV